MQLLRSTRVCCNGHVALAAATFNSRAPQDGLGFLGNPFGTGGDVELVAMCNGQFQGVDLDGILPMTTEI
jgi:hypothetical protein